MKILVVLFLAIQIACLQAGVVDPPEPTCEITEAALEELRQLRSIVDQLRSLVETLVARPVVEPPKPDTECQRQGKEVEGRGFAIGAYKPTCTDEGAFTPQQCHPSTGHCWCVDEDTGEEVADSRSGPGEDRIECVSDSMLPCSFRGAFIQHGGSLRIDVCTVCTCNDSSTTCNIEACLELDCPEDLQVWYPDNCCASCPADWGVPPCEISGTCGEHGGILATPECRFEFCIGLWEPVCGSDGHTYSNPCAFANVQCLNDSLTYTEGECPDICPEGCLLEHLPVCGTDRKTYNTRCELERARCNSEDGTPTLDYEGNCRVESDEIRNATLTTSWKEATLNWTAPEDEVNGYVIEVTTNGRKAPKERLSLYDTFYTMEVSPNQTYTIAVTPIMGTGPGTTYTTDSFTPVCPAVCTFEYDPKCGTDGNTYSNLCALEIAQCQTGDKTLVIDYEGACDPCAGIACDPPVCPEGHEIGEVLPGECCPGCVDPCEGIFCDAPICERDYVVAAALAPGECCLGCERQVFEDCANAQALGMSESGLYLIRPVGVDEDSEPFEVWCDLEDGPGGWTVILRRQESDINFLRDYDEYVKGFGDPSEAYWIGLENLYRLNKNDNTRMFVTGTDHLGATASGQYNIFRVGAADTQYTLETIVGFRPTPGANIGNALAYNKGARFSAPDQDNDNGIRNCAEVLSGGWWHKGKPCTRANPLGEFLLPGDFRPEQGIFWATFRGKGKSLQFLEIKIRPPPVV